MKTPMQFILFIILNACFLFACKQKKHENEHESAFAKKDDIKLELLNTSLRFNCKELCHLIANKDFNCEPINSDHDSSTFEEYIVDGNYPYWAQALCHIGAFSFFQQCKTFKFGDDFSNKVVKKNFEYLMLYKTNYSMQVVFMAPMDANSKKFQVYSIEEEIQTYSVKEYLLYSDKQVPVYCIAIFSIDHLNASHLNLFVYAEKDKAFYHIQNAEELLFYKNQVGSLIAFNHNRDKKNLEVELENLIKPLADFKIFHLAGSNIQQPKAVVKADEPLVGYQMPNISPAFNQFLNWQYREKELSFHVVDKIYSKEELRSIKNYHLEMIGFRKVYSKNNCKGIELCAVFNYDYCNQSNYKGIYSIDKFLLSGKDSVLSIFVYNNTNYKSEKMIVVLSATKNKVYTNMYNFMCGVHGCCNLEEIRYVNHDNVFSQVKCYEDFLKQYPSIAKNYQ